MERDRVIVRHHLAARSGGGSALSLRRLWCSGVVGAEYAAGGAGVLRGDGGGEPVCRGELSLFCDQEDSEGCQGTGGAERGGLRVGGRALAMLAYFGMGSGVWW